MDDAYDYIRVDVKKLDGLKSAYEEAMAMLKDELPDINWNSPKQIVEYFQSGLNLKIPNAKIGTIENAQMSLLADSEAFEIVDTLVAYLKLKYSLKNYIYCLLSHETDGFVILRWVDGKLVMPNKQPLSYNEEIQECILDWSSNVPKFTKEWSIKMQRRSYEQ